MLRADLTDLLLRDLFKFFADQLPADLLRLRRSIIYKELSQGHERVGVAAVQDLTALAQAHEAVACPAFPVAGRAEGRDVIVLHQPPYHFVKRPLVADVELLGLCRPDLLGITAHGSPGSSADLRDTHLQRLFPDVLALSGGDDHAGIGHRQADAGDDLEEGLVVDAAVELVRDRCRPRASLWGR